MNTVTEKQRQQWVSIRQRGRFRFLIFHGVLRSGLLFAMLMSLGSYFSFLTDTGWRGFPFEIYIFIFHAVFFGVITSLYAWNTNEKNFLTNANSTH